MIFFSKLRKRFKNKSLRLRLILLFSALAIITWAVASSIAWQQTRHKINEVFDTQQMLFAKRLATAGLGDMLLDAKTQNMPETKAMVDKHHRGHTDDDALTFAIFDRQGHMLLNDGEHGKAMRFNSEAHGFIDTELKDDDNSWRVLWLTSTDGHYRIAVGQEYDYRSDMAWDMVSGQLVPWLASLPLLMLAMIVMLSLELRPLRRVAKELQSRAADDAQPLATERVPGEIMPLVQSLNALFARTQDMLVRERRFTSDAAHELRSPLAALRVQTEVVQLAGDDARVRDNAVQNLTTSIDRATRLVDQLLTLSRLESFTTLDASHDETGPVDWLALVTQTLIEQDTAAHRNGIELILENNGTPPPMCGQALLLSLMLRNLLDNAIRYSPGGSEIRVTISRSGLTLVDRGPGMNTEQLQRLGERFYRPPGQDQSGSGLGISIVLRIAQLHGISVSYTNNPQCGLRVSLNVC
ncbi:two-component system sensor histidine kinase QseC [Rouxiella sp. S1S-2]|uniref:quorum sensing histidine kinase QseC n=1 Tax=Rouxiella sp. S1S-2 TaxID=2653856 RepID=UPI001264353F|nr:quorum sensing histidine kinase QseC [Rouxiella sp. S1S-2]KAB7898342.1 two-component system sensor histidine kinase QseC [Rouxiella sp. S1S-2]